MANPLDQLYKTKLQLIAVLAVVGGIACLMVAPWSATSAAPSWLAILPISEFGHSLLGTGLLAIFFEYVDRKHGEERTDQRIREAVRQEAPAIRDAVLDSFAFNAETLKNVVSDDTLDRITTNALGLRLGDADLARDVYTDLRNQVIHAPERRYDLDVSVSLSPSSVGPATGHGSMFVATIRWAYRSRPASDTIRIACVSDLEEYRASLRDPTVSGSWYFSPSAGINAGSREAFELMSFIVNGRERTVRRSERRGSQLYSANLGRRDDEGEVNIVYTYRVLVKRHGHMLYIDLPRPTKGLHVQLNYADAGIRHVNTLDFFASSEQSRVDQTPSSSPAKTVDISFDGWIFPRSGVAFVWVLEEEMKAKG